MARWTSMTWDDFKTRYRVGADRGKTSWSSVLLQLTSLAGFVNALNTLRDVNRHHLDVAQAKAHLHAALLFLTGTVAVVAWIVRQEEMRRDLLLPALLLGGGSALAVLVLCWR